MMATDSQMTARVTTPNNNPRYTGKDVAKGEGISYKRNNLGGTQKKRDNRSEKRY